MLLGIGYPLIDMSFPLSLSPSLPPTPTPPPPPLVLHQILMKLVLASIWASFTDNPAGFNAQDIDTHTLSLFLSLSLSRNAESLQFDISFPLSLPPSPPHPHPTTTTTISTAPNPDEVSSFDYSQVSGPPSPIILSIQDIATAFNSFGYYRCVEAATCGSELVETNPYNSPTALEQCFSVV